MRWLSFARSVESGSVESPCWFESSRPEGRPLLPLEGAVRDAALVCLLEYFESPGVGEAPVAAESPGEDVACEDLLQDQSGYW
jgi:hypothetical protein